MRVSFPFAFSQLCSLDNCILSWNHPIQKTSPDSYLLELKLINTSSYKLPGLKNSVIAAKIRQ